MTTLLDTRETGVTDTALREAYMKLWRAHKDGEAGYSGVLLGPAAEILTASLHAEPAGKGLYRITEAGAKAWALMVAKLPRNIKTDKQLMEKAGFTVTLQDFLNELSNGEWQSATEGTSNYVRKVARENGFVETRGNTSAREYRITPEGQTERVRLGAAPTAAVRPETTPARPLQMKSESVVMCDVPADEPDITVVPYDANFIVDRINALAAADGKADMDAGDYVNWLRTQVAHLQGVYALMRQGELNHHSAVEYVQHLLTQVDQLTSERDNQIAIVDTIVQRAAEQGYGDLNVLHYIAWLQDVVNVLSQSNATIAQYIAACYSAEVARLMIRYGA